MKSLCASFLSIALLAAGCGSDDDGNSGGASKDAAITSCKSYCDKDQAAACGLYGSAQECYDFECDIPGSPPAACVNAIKAYYDCLGASSDICNEECTTEANAQVPACS
jgi:hypothetical protein